MKTITTFLKLLLLFSLPVPLLGQAGQCTSFDVTQNTVAPCTTVIGNVINVATTPELKSAIDSANSNGGNMTILIADGNYQISSPAWYPIITGDDIVIRSQSGNRDNVVLYGSGMANIAPDIEMGFEIIGWNVTVADLTIKEMGTNGIYLTGRDVLVHNVKIIDTYEHMIKGGDSLGGPQGGKIQCSYFAYTAGVAPNWNVGGVNLQRSNGIEIIDNYFQDIASLQNGAAGYAIHLWNNNVIGKVMRNRILNCDRGIAMGRGMGDNVSGSVLHNMIYNDGLDPSDQEGIFVETIDYVQIFHNTVIVQYVNAIEYSWLSDDVEIINNLCNRSINPVNNGQATVYTNVTNAQDAWFTDVSTCDLHIGDTIASIVDQGFDFTFILEFDIDMENRPSGFGFDIGADEYYPMVAIAEEKKAGFSLYPNPSSGMVALEIQENSAPATYTIFDLNGRTAASGTLSVFRQDLDLTHLSPGTYFLSLQTASGILSKKLILTE